MPRQYINSPIPHICEQCGNSFMTHASAKRRYCSHACYWDSKRKRPDTICGHCGKLFAGYAGQPNRYCDTTCRDEAQRRRVERTCPTCGTAFACRPKDRKRFCSPKCAAVMNPANQPRPHRAARCGACGAVFELNRSTHHKSYTGRYCSRRCSDSVNKNPPAQAWTSKPCSHCGVVFLCPPWRPEIAHCSIKCAKRHAAQITVGERHPLWKPRTPMACEACGTVVLVKPCHAARFRACSRRCASVLGQQAWPRISSIERAMADAFRMVGLTPTAQHIIGPYIVDFAFPLARLVVECDGTYWHGRPQQQVKDTRKDAYLARHGWQVVRLREQAITASPIICAEQVASLLHRTVPAGEESP